MLFVSIICKIVWHIYKVSIKSVWIQLGYLPLFFSSVFEWAVLSRNMNGGVIIDLKPDIKTFNNDPMIVL